MALNNCTINSSSVNVTPSQILGSGVANQVLTITPNTGFRVAATNFTNNSGNLTGVESIALEDSGTAYAANNTVTVTVDLDNDFNPGTSHHTITIDIDGNATNEKDIPITLAGTYTVDGTNITQSDETNVAYSVEGDAGTTQDVISKTVTASAGNYFETEPTIVITGNLDDYTVTTTTSNDGNGNLTSKVFDIDAIIPLENVSGDTIKITASAEAIPEDANRINAYSFDTSDMSQNLTKRIFKAYGDEGAKFKLRITRQDNYTYDFSAGDFTLAFSDSGEATIGSDGSWTFLTVFVAVTDDVDYTFEIFQVAPTTLNLTQDNPFTVSRVGYRSVTVNATSETRGTFQSKVISYTDYAGDTITATGGTNPIWGQDGSENENDVDAEFNFSIVVDDDEAFVFSAPNAAQNTITLDSTHYSSAGIAEIGEGTATATRAADSGSNANQLLTITGTDWFNWKHSLLLDHVITFNIDEFCDPVGGGGSNVLQLYTDTFYGYAANPGIMSPASYSRTVTGRESGSTTITYQYTNVVLNYPDVPSFVDGLEDVCPPAFPMTASSIAPSETKFSPSSLDPPLSSYPITNITHTLANPGTTSVQLTSSFTITITNFDPAVTSGDDLKLQINYGFWNYGNQ